MRLGIQLNNLIMQIHYALQTCDTKSYQGLKRYASDDRTEISKKCIVSFLQSVQHCSEKKENTTHNIVIIDDCSSKELKQFIQDNIKKYTNNKIKIESIELKEKTGIQKSIECCYHWLQKNGKDLVYQVQDDYLFTIDAITDLVDMFNQMKTETGMDIILSPWNDNWNWLTAYRNISTPRMVIVGKRGYWIQYYDMSCSFLTSHEQFSKHWDLYHRFFELIPNINKDKGKYLENVSLNYMLTNRNVLGLIPINSVAFHLQSDLEKDPHIDYKPIWDNINVT